MKKFYFILAIYAQAYAQVPNNTTAKFVDKNRVKARIHTVNNKFWNIYGNGAASYEVPKGKGASAQFCNSMWIGGFDSQGQLHVSANTYRQLGTDFWPGPLDTSNIIAFNSTFTSVYNKLWKVDCDDINAYVNAFSNGSVTANTYTVPPDLLAYPAKGIANFQKNLEPFYDANGNGQYNPSTDGDYPIIKGHQQVLSIYNDYFTTHTETKAPPMGLEIHERSYCYYDPNLPDSMKAVNYSTFYHYTIYNRSSEKYSNVFISDWSDVDLGGNYLDDYIGTDTLNNFAYCYNADSFDESNNAIGYGSKPPVVSHAIIKTPCTSDGIDNDGDGQTDESGEQFLMNRTTFYNNNIGSVPPPTINPDSAIHYYRYMSGYWKNNMPFTFGGAAYGGTMATKYVYPGNPATNSGWTEASAGNAPGDRRVIFSSGPFTFPAYSKLEWGYAVIFSQDTTQNVNTITQFNTRVQRDVRNVKYFDETHQAAQCTPAITTALNEKTMSETGVLVYPNPAQQRITVELSNTNSNAVLRLLDVSGRLIEEKQSSGQRSDFDLSKVESGVYFVEIQTAGGKITRKVIRN